MTEKKKLEEIPEKKTHPLDALDAPENKDLSPADKSLIEKIILHYEKKGAKVSVYELVNQFKDPVQKKYLKELVS